eukprot:SAG31_NODE_21_length_34109_cov_60.598824_24_plen_263_part_00
MAGGSDKPTAPYTIEDMANDALDLLRALFGRHQQAGCNGGAHVVGQSMGGMIAQRMAVLEPRLVRSIVLCSTVSWCDGRTAAYWGSLPQLARSLPAADFTRSLLPWMFGRATLEDPDHPAMTVALGAADSVATILPTPPHTYEIQVATMLQFDSRPWLSQISQPALVIVGTDDIGTPPYQSEYISQHIHGAQLHKFEGAGHRAINEHHEEFCTVLTDFVKNAATPSKATQSPLDMATSNFSVGFVGLGNMGGAIVRAMLRRY